MESATISDEAADALRSLTECVDSIKDKCLQVID
jgi:hypothetical protein